MIFLALLPVLIIPSTLCQSLLQTGHWETKKMFS